MVINVGIGLGLGLGFHRWESAAISTGVGLAVGELEIGTQPRSSVELLAHYRGGHLGAPPPAHNALFLRPLLGGDLRGLAFAGTI